MAVHSEDTKWQEAFGWKGAAQLLGAGVEDGEGQNWHQAEVRHVAGDCACLAHGTARIAEGCVDCLVKRLKRGNFDSRFRICRERVRPKVIVVQCLSCCNSLCWVTRQELVQQVICLRTNPKICQPPWFVVPNEEKNVLVIHGLDPPRIYPKPFDTITSREGVVVGPGLLVGRTTELPYLVELVQV